MRLIFRVHGLDMPELNQAEEAIRRLARECGFEADVSKVNEILEHGRMGIGDALPVLEINGTIVSVKTPLTMDKLRPIFEKLSSLFSRTKPSA